MPIIDVVLGKNARIFQPDLVNLYGCKIGNYSTIGPFVEIQAGASVGSSCKIQSHTFICEGVTIGDRVFIGHGVIFTNDAFPRASNSDGSLLTSAEWRMETTVVEDDASIGSGVTILPGITIGRRAMIGAGAVVTRDVDADAVVVGNPARQMRYR